MRILKIVFLLVTVTTDIYSADSSRVSISVFCPAENSQYWTGDIYLRKKGKFWLVKQDKATNLPYGKYQVSLASDFKDSLDTIITIDKKEMKITLNVKRKYILDVYSDSILTKADVIIIQYDGQQTGDDWVTPERDRIYLYKKPTGQYLARYYTQIVTDLTKVSWSEKILSSKKIKLISNHFQTNNFKYEPGKIINFIVKIGNHVYSMKYQTYMTFRHDLIYEN
jgi:hypothetical protein